jgi:hypothetical protein
MYSSRKSISLLTATLLSVLKAVAGGGDAFILAADARMMAHARALARASQIV